MPTTKRVYTTSVVMPCDIDQYKNALHEQLLKMTEKTLDLNVLGLAHMRFVYFHPKKGVMWDVTVSPPESGEKRIGMREYNPELFLAIASISYADRLWSGEWVILEKDVSGELKAKKGSFVKIIKITERDIRIEYQGKRAFLHENFPLRKATAEELIDHFMEEEKVIDMACGLSAGIRAQEPVAKEPIFKLDDHVTGLIKGNGMRIYGYYIEPSNLGDWHYMQEDGTTVISACENVHHVKMSDIPIGDLIKVYAHVNNVHHLTIRANIPQDRKF